MDTEQHHYVYKTTNKSTGQFYVGVHSTYNLNDGYMGSGVLLKRAINTGKYEFDCEVIKYCDSREEALELESFIVDNDFLLREDTYNMILGGVGTYDTSSNQVPREARKGKVMAVEISTGINKVVDLTDIDEVNYRLLHKGLKRSKSTREKLSKISKHKVLAHDRDGRVVRVSRSEFEAGDYKGIHKGTKWYHCPSTFRNVKVKSGDLPPEGYVEGRYDDPVKKQTASKNTSKRRRASIWITNGVVDRSINKTDPIPTGWRRGRSNGVRRKK